ncbi:MAG: lysophospholipid acyltransferase family protein [Terracidiphilus sp.]
MNRVRPDPLPWFYRWRTDFVQTPLFALITASFGSLALTISLFERSGSLQHRIARVWARGCVWFSGSKMKVVGAENLHRCKVAVYTSNHTSYMDTPVIFSALPFQFRILARSVLWSIPFIGWYLNRSGQIPIDTSNPRATVSSLGEGARALRSGMALFVFPEGRRTLDGRLQPFLSGAAYLAIRAQVPLVPMALNGVFELLPMHTRHFFPGELMLRVGRPIETRGMSLRQTDELTEQLRVAIQELIEMNRLSA